MYRALLLIVFIIVALAVLWLIWMLLRPSFFRDMRYLNTEITRTHGEEREKWIQHRKRLLLTMIPFVRRKN